MTSETKKIIITSNFYDVISNNWWKSVDVIGFAEASGCYIFLRRKKNASSNKLAMAATTITKLQKPTQPRFNAI